MKSLSLILFLCFMPIAAMSQNLVLNPSFEDSKTCAEEKGHFRYRLHHWSTPSNGTTDLFNPCVEGETGAPENFMGTQKAEFGDNYAGAFLYVRGNYREYLQGKLSNSLEKGKTYRVSVYISLAENSDHAVKNFGFLFTDRAFKIRQQTTITERWLKKSYLKNFELHEVESDSFFENKKEWVRISAEFTADGYENYITLGNFRNNLQSEAKFLESKEDPDLAYYYIDMISVEAVEDPEEMLVENEPKKLSDAENPKPKKSFEFNKDFIFENVKFDFDSAVLKDGAKEEIESVFQFLIENEGTNIIISGHTDEVGSEDFNKNLSENRAKAVAGYFIELGLNENRIKTLGFGTSRPLASNDTHEGRSKNRRVEFKILAQKDAYN